MTKDEFALAMDRFFRHPAVKEARKEAGGRFSLEILTGADRSRSQAMMARLGEDGLVEAWSVVGPCPDSLETVKQLLGENVDGCYSRLALADGKLLQMYRHPIAELEAAELAKGLLEVARTADYLESRYFDGADVH